MVQNNLLISGNTDLTRVAFISVVEYAVNTTCTQENVMEAFSATGVVPFNLEKINVGDFPSSSAG